MNGQTHYLTIIVSALDLSLDHLADDLKYLTLPTPDQVNEKEGCDENDRKVRIEKLKTVLGLELSRDKPLVIKDIEEALKGKLDPKMQSVIEAQLAKLQQSLTTTAN